MDTSKHSESLSISQNKNMFQTESRLTITLIHLTAMFLVKARYKIMVMR